MTNNKILSKEVIKMTKKKHKILSIVMSIALAMTLCIGMALPAFAANGMSDGGTPDAPAQAAITKMLKLPVGTTIPDFTFTFAFDKLLADGSADQGDLDAMPALKDVLIAFNANSTACKVDGDGTKWIHGEELINFDLDADNNPIVWPHAGQYEYLVYETNKNYSTPQNVDYTDEMFYSPAEYKIVVYVANGKDGKGNDVLYINTIAAYIETKDGTEGGEPGTKVDPTPGGDPSLQHDHSKVIFTNYYLKNTGGVDPEDPNNSTLAISKTVGGEYGDRQLPFEFSVTVTNPAIIDDPNTTFMAYVLNEQDQVVTSAMNVADANFIKTDLTYGDYIEFTTDEPMTIYLKHGQRLVFTDLPVGAKYEVSESGTQYYTPSRNLTINGGTPLYDIAAEGAPLAIPQQYVTEGIDLAAFLNKYQDVIPGGISVNDLPYIVMVGLGTLALAGFAVFKFRKRAKNEA